MTTIAYDGRSIAADMLETMQNGERLPKGVHKIMRCSIPKHLGAIPEPPKGSIPDGYEWTVVPRREQPRQRVIVAFSGTLLGARELLEHHVNGTRVLGQPIGFTQVGPHGSLIVVHLDTDDCNTVFIGSDGSTSDITGCIYASGSGGDYAVGAMYAGKGAHQAVEIAAICDTATCSKAIESISFTQAKEEPESMYPFYID